MPGVASTVVIIIFKSFGFPASASFRSILAKASLGRRTAAVTRPTVGALEGRAVGRVGKAVGVCTGAALAADGVSLGRKRPEPDGGPDDRLPLAHAPWLFFLAPQYDCERRDGLIAPKLVPIAVDDTAMNDASAQALASAICGVVGTAATYGQRCAVLATLETESLAADQRCALVLFGLCRGL